MKKISKNKKTKQSKKARKLKAQKSTQTRVVQKQVQETSLTHEQYGELKSAPSVQSKRAKRKQGRQPSQAKKAAAGAKALGLEQSTVAPLREDSVAFQEEKKKQEFATQAVSQDLSAAAASTFTSAPNRAALFCFLGIFACMLLLESTRFKAYFEGESGEYPILRTVGEYVSQGAEMTGIAPFMQSLGKFTQDMSQEFLVQADVPLAEQWGKAREFYATIWDAQPKEDVTAQKTEQKPESNIETGPKADSELSPEPIPAPVPKPDADVSPKVAESESEEESVEIELLPEYAFYDATRATAAPSAQGIEEYLTKLPNYGKRLKILIIGDSMMMEGLGPTLQKALRQRKDIEVVREGRYSSGLSKPDFFNWPENLKKLLIKHNPDMLIISLGANDTQDIMVGKRRFQIDTEGWERVYAIRVINFLELATENNRKVLWVSLPVMGRMPYANRTRLINAITEDMSSFYPAVSYENIEHLLTQNGKYTSFIKGKDNKTIRLRSKDNIHVSTAGGQILTNYILPYADERVNVIRMEEVGGNPFIPVAGKANTVRFSSVSRKKDVEYVVYLPEPRHTESSASSDALQNTMDLMQHEAHPVPQNIWAVQNLQAKAKQMGGVSVQQIVLQSLQENSPAQEGTVQNIERFPVLYLLHGATGHAKDWNTYLGKELQALANEKRVILVAPEAEDFGWYADSALLEQNQIESFMMEELLPQVDMLFPTNGKRALAGLSMGGHGAMTLGFKYPKQFTSVASISGVLDIRLHPEQWKLAEVFGVKASNETVWSKHSAAYLMEKSKKNAHPKQILITTGLQDSLVLADNQSAQVLLEKKAIPFEYVELEGGHDWEFWQQEIPKLLRKQADFLYQE